MTLISKTIFNITEDYVNTRIMIQYNTKTDHISICKLYNKSTNQKNNDIIYCRICNDVLVENINWLTSYKNSGHYVCNDCAKKSDRDRYIKIGKDNSLCPTYLGVDITEKILLNIFNDTKKMRNGNPGFDFICSNNYKIDCKSSCRRINKNSNTWSFVINHNTIADYFLCLAFDNRKDLNPEHIWLIPGQNVNYKNSITISELTLYKWDNYKINKLDKIIKCCNVIKDNLKEE